MFKDGDLVVFRDFIKADFVNQTLWRMDNNDKYIRAIHRLREYEDRFYFDSGMALSSDWIRHANGMDIAKLKLGELFIYEDEYACVEASSTTRR